jgi:hypothetical protein
VSSIAIAARLTYRPFPILILTTVTFAYEKFVTSGDRLLPPLADSVQERGREELSTQHS